MSESRSSGHDRLLATVSAFFATLLIVGTALVAALTAVWGTLGMIGAPDSVVFGAAIPAVVVCLYLGVRFFRRSYAAELRLMAGEPPPAASD